ncbi:hypothetical protein F5880DRAFT_1571619 [Lentinula raphanica]|nr:hypothetical protein F5880DRAFT_1571619 [Lentinula raphanica]
MHLSKLPLEILDSILSEIDDHDDLIALALASKDLHRIVIPRHSEYRVLRIRHRFPALWAHLALRADLSRNLREIQITQRDNQALVERYPTTPVSSYQANALGMVDSPDPHQEERERVKNLLVVMEHTQRLKAFHWDFRHSVGTLFPEQELQLLASLSRISELRTLVIAGELRCVPLAQFQMAWNMPHLQDLTLMGNIWTSLATARSLKHVLKQCTQLRRLQIPMDAIGLGDLIIPTLRDLSLFLQSGTTSAQIKQWNVFLENHPLLEDLWCNPSSTLVLPRNGLRKLKRLSVETKFLDSFEGAEFVPEELECLQCENFRFLDFDGGGATGCYGLGKLKKLYLLSVASEDELQMIAASCPALTWLHINGSATFDLNVWLTFFSSLPHLQVFRGPALWRSVQDDFQRMHAAIAALVQRCPELRELDHQSKHDKRGKKHKIVIVKEEAEDGSMHVRYEVERVYKRESIYLMDYAFA